LETFGRRFLLLFSTLEVLIHAEQEIILPQKAWIPNSIPQKAHAEAHLNRNEQDIQEYLERHSSRKRSS